MAAEVSEMIDSAESESERAAMWSAMREEVERRTAALVAALVAAREGKTRRWKTQETNTRS
jgi:hypothetical protein